MLFKFIYILWPIVRAWVRNMGGRKAFRRELPLAFPDPWDRADNPFQATKT